jgi:WD40 repeat protein
VFSPDGTRILSADFSGLSLWEAGTLKLVRRFERSEEFETFLSVSYSPDGQRFVSGGSALKLWEANTGRLLRTFEKNSTENAVAFSSDGTKILSGNRDKTVKLWDVSSGRLLRTFEGHTDEVI